MNSQWDRTRLAWSRTVVAVIGVVLLGAFRLATGGLVAVAVVAGVLGAAACIAGILRMRALQNEQLRPATWEPLAVAGAACVLALAVLVTA